ncbi:MAG: putative Ig domain-containing protein [Chitinophagaceae bacterium]|nr:putative Ig domain-containing protein [Chitinophagaceae bacterium]
MKLLFAAWNKPVSSLYQKSYKLFILLICLILGFNFKSTAQTTLAVGDLSIIGVNSNGTDNFDFVSWVDMTPGTFIKFTDCGINSTNASNTSGNLRATENFVIWQNNTGGTIPAGTVIQIAGLTTSLGACTAGSAGGLNGLSASGDQIFAYQSAANTGAAPNVSPVTSAGTLTGTMLFGITFGNNWLSTGTTGANTTYLPSDLNVANGNIALTTASTSHGQYTGFRSGQTNMNDYKAMVTNPANWTTGTGSSATITLDLTAFTIVLGTPTITTSGTLTAVNTQYGTASPTPTTFNVSGTNISGSILITAPTGYEISKTAPGSSGYNTSQSLPASLGVVANTTIYVRLSANAQVSGSPYAGDIVLSNGATSVNVPTVSSTVTPIDLTITGITADNKVFDGFTTATLSGTPVLVGVLSADIPNVLLGGTPVADFVSPLIGTGIPVIVSGYTISGSAASNYNLLQPTGLTADITASPTPVINSALTFSATYGAPATSYFITATEFPTSYNATGLPPGLSINTTTGEISGTPTAVAGSPFSVTITATNLGGSGTATLIYTIDPAVITVSSPTGVNKVYDRNTDATYTGTLVGVVGLDNVSLNGVGTFAQFTVGTGIAITSTASTLTGPDAGNYTLVQPSGMTADITPKDLTINGATALNKIFDGTTTATITGTLNGVISPDVVNVTFSGNFASSAIGNGIAVTSNSVLGGANAANYNLIQPSGLTANILPQPVLTTDILPLYMQGVNGTNSNRLPYTYRATISNLTPNATYRYINQVVVASDAANISGAGNVIYADPGGFVRTTAAGFVTPGSYGTFTADAGGNYTGWFISEPTGNATRFTPGLNVYMRISLNDGAGGTTAIARLTTTDSVKIINLVASAGANNGTGLRGNSNATAKNFVFVWDNPTASGRPLSGSYVESDGVANTTGNSFASFYSTNVEGVAGAYGMIIPNTNPNGVQRIEQRDFATGNMIGCATDADGIWPSGSNTVNPVTGGTAKVITIGDAPLDICCVAPVITSLTNNGPICSTDPLNLNVMATGTAPLAYVWAGTGSFTNGSTDATTVTGAATGIYTVTVSNACGSTTSTIAVTVNTCTATLNLTALMQGYYRSSDDSMTSTLFNQGELNASTDCDTVTVELRDATSPYAVAYSYTGVIGTNGQIACTFPGSAVGNSYYIAIRNRTTVETWSASPVLTAASFSYDFRTSDAQAFGNNMILVNLSPVRWAIFSGDLDQSGGIDGDDFNILDPNIQTGNGGYLNSDIDGSGGVDGDDFNIFDPNSQAGVGAILP